MASHFRLISRWCRPFCTVSLRSPELLMIQDHKRTQAKFWGGSLSMSLLQATVFILYCYCKVFRASNHTNIILTVKHEPIKINMIKALAAQLLERCLWHQSLWLCHPSKDIRGTLPSSINRALHTRPFLCDGGPITQISHEGQKQKVREIKSIH